MYPITTPNQRSLTTTDSADSSHRERSVVSTVINWLTPKPCVHVLSTTRIMDRQLGLLVGQAFQPDGFYLSAVRTHRPAPQKSTFCSTHSSGSSAHRKVRRHCI